MPLGQSPTRITSEDGLGIEPRFDWALSPERDGSSLPGMQAPDAKLRRLIVPNGATILLLQFWVMVGVSRLNPRAHARGDNLSSHSGLSISSKVDVPR